MSQNRDSSPVFYREIQKNAYLKRIPDDFGISKLRPLALKKPPLKPLWTQLCVHNGRTPYLEQYRDPTSARAHRPVWRANLVTARHVTASVTSRDNEHDFLVDTHHGPVRMLAPDWESMQDWVTTLRNKLHELKILPLCENVYAPPPAAPLPRAAARDPTSPLPPTPPVPPDRVPGIDLTPIIRPTQPPEPIAEQINQETPEAILQEPPQLSPPVAQIPDTSEEIDISNWDAPFTSLPSTSQVTKGLAKICGQNICLDDSIFKRTDDETDSDEEHGDGSQSDKNSYRQTVVINSKDNSVDSNESERPSNVTVIQVSNKEPPHTAIPILGPDTNVFQFDFKTPRDPDFVNIVNTEVNVQGSNEYGTVFTKDESEYGHLSLTTTVNLTGDVKDTSVNVKPNNEGIYERLCQASTSDSNKASPLSVRRLKTQEKLRKSSLPNLDSNYEYLFLSQNNSNCNNRSDVTCNITSTNLGTECNIQRNVTESSGCNIPRNVTQAINTISTITAPISTVSTHASTTISTNDITNVTSISTNNVRLGADVNSSRVHVNSVAICNVDSNARLLRSNIERSHSQNACDASPRRDLHREQNSPKRNGKMEKDSSQGKPIWKRGLTELSLLTRLRGIGQGKRQDSPSRNGDNDRNAISPVKVNHRSRPEVRYDRSRRRSSSLSNGQSPSTSVTPALLPLRARQAAALRSEQRRGAALVAAIRCIDPPVFADYNKQVWVSYWGSSGSRVCGRVGDRVCGVRATLPKDAAHATQLLHNARAIDILFHRVPLGKIYVVNKRDQENIGIKLDNECNITSVEGNSPAARAGIPPPGKWAVTEVNNQPINLIKGGEEDMNRLSLHGTEASVLIQPSAFVKKLRASLKGNKSLLGLR